jgi:hypothetical protein
MFHRRYGALFCLGELAVVPDVFFKGSLWDLAEGQVKGKMRYQRPHVQDCELAQITELPDFWPALFAEYDYSGVDGSGTHRIQDITGMAYLTGLKTVGEGAFLRHSLMTTQYFESLLEGFMIPAGVETVKDYAFYGSIQLYAKLDNFETVEHIGHSVFRDCRRLYGVLKFNDNITVIPDKFGEGLARDNMVWKEDSSKNGITQLTLPDSLVEIGSEAFINAVGMHGTLDLKNVQRIGSYAFRYTQFAGDLYLPDTLICDSSSSMQSEAFMGISSMTGTLHLSENPAFKIISQSLLRGTPLTGALVIPGNVEEIYGFAFMDTNFSGKVTVPNSVTSMFAVGLAYGYTFANNRNITEFEVQGHCGNYIGDGFLQECTKLETVTFQNSVGGIGQSSFAGCVELETVNLNGAVITSVGAYGFLGCSKLTSFPTKDLTVIGEAAFSGIPLTGDSGVLDLSAAVDIGGFYPNGFRGDAFNSVAVTGVTFGTSLRRISRNTFGSGRNFGDFLLPEGLTTFMNDSIIGRSIRRWNVPSTLMYISYYAYSAGGAIQINSHTISCDELYGTFNITGPAPGWNNPSTFTVDVIFNDLDGDGVLDIDVTGTLCYAMRVRNPDLGAVAEYNGVYIAPAQFRQLLGIFNVTGVSTNRYCYFGQSTYEDYIAAYPGKEELTAARMLGWRFFYYSGSGSTVEVS